MQSTLKYWAMLVLVLAGATSLVIPLRAQPLPGAPNPNDQVIVLRGPQTELKLIEKFARILELEQRIASVYGFDAEIVNVTKVDGNPRQIRVHALTPGITQMVLVDENNQAFSLDLFVSGDVRHLQAHINKLFPDSVVEVVEVKDNTAVVLRGWVTQPEHITSLVDVAKQFYPQVLNQIQVGGVQQVQLRVKVMEVQRSKIRRMGFNFLYTSDSAVFASTPGALSPLTALATPLGGAPTGAINPTGGGSLAFGLVGDSHAFQGFVDALKEEGLLKINAQPTITTTNGRPATLQNGGEFPVLVPQGLGTVSIEWREFGVQLSAVPIILGNGRLRLELAPEVSERDFSNSVNLNGLIVPGLTTRRINTQVEMRFGETLIIGGLIAFRKTAATSKIPFLGELPYVGGAFNRRRYDEVETELVVMVTPELVAPLNCQQLPKGGPGEFTTTPTDRELYLDSMIEVPNYGDRCQDCNKGGYPMMGPGLGAPSPTPALNDPKLLPPDHAPTLDLPTTPNENPDPILPAPGVSRRGNQTRPGQMPPSQTQQAQAQPFPAPGAIRRAEYSPEPSGQVPTYNLQSPSVQSPPPGTNQRYYTSPPASNPFPEGPGLIAPPPLNPSSPSSGSYFPQNQTSPTTQSPLLVP